MYRQIKGLCIILQFIVIFPIFLYILCFIKNGNSFKVFRHVSIKYVVMVDAGSSGSRLFVNSISPVMSQYSGLPFIEICKDEHGAAVTKKITPGLSSYVNNYTGIKDYINSILSVAAAYIPDHLHSTTPVLIYGTAGMRLLSTIEQENIWEFVRSSIREKYKFKFENSYCQTVSGVYEALYGWIATNYLLHLFPTENENLIHKPMKTVGTLDLGGASLQIAFEVPPSAQTPGDNILKFEIGRGNYADRYYVYVTSFLGYGSHFTMIKYRIQLLKSSLWHSKRTVSRLTNSHNNETTEASLTYLKTDVKYSYANDGSQRIILSDPCLPSGLQDTLDESELKASGILLSLSLSSILTSVIYEGTGNLTACINYQKGLLKKNFPCKQNPCSMNGVHQPSIDFENTTFYAMSEFWYTTTDVLENLSDFQLTHFRRSSEAFCRNHWNNTLSKYMDAHLEEADIIIKKTVCFKAAWVINIMLTGFEFPIDYMHLQPVDEVDGNEVQWGLGALLYNLPELMQLTSLRASVIEPKCSYVVPLMLACIFVVIFCLVIFCRMRRFSSVLLALRRTTKILLRRFRPNHPLLPTHCAYKRALTPDLYIDEKTSELSVLNQNPFYQSFSNSRHLSHHSASSPNLRFSLHPFNVA